MAELADKYDGDIQGCLRDLRKEKIGVDTAPIDRSAMKRKWVTSQEADADGRPMSPSKARAAKNREHLLLLSASCLLMMVLIWKLV